jgi:uncharacterized protein (TIGR02145 family)
VKMIFNAGNAKDADGNVYQTVRIGNQVWTVENIKTTKYNDGTEITHVPDNSEWSNLYETGSATGAYCYYENSPANGAKYGALYDWDAVNTGKLAPEGWRVPTDADWDTLETYLIANGYNWDKTTTGSKIGQSMAAKTDWCISTEKGSIGSDLSNNNTSGFSALPGGYRYQNGSFQVQSFYGYWWCATEYDASDAYCRVLGCYGGGMGTSNSTKRRGFSVRLLRND